MERIFRLKIAEDLLFMDLVDRTTEPPHSTEIYKKRLAIAKRRLEQNEGGNEQSEEAPAISGTRASISYPKLDSRIVGRTTSKIYGIAYRNLVGDGSSSCLAPFLP